MKISVYQALIICGLIAMPMVTCASGVPVYGDGEVANMELDKEKSNEDKGLIDVHNELMQSALDALGGIKSFSPASFKSELKDNLTDPSKAVSGYDGLMTLLGPNSGYGEIKIKKC